MSVSTKDSKEKERKKKEFNEKVIEYCPYLWPRGQYTHRKDQNYDYSYSVFDYVPDGWRKKFILDFCKELNIILDKLTYTEENPYIPTRINSIFGHFTVHSTWTNPEIDELVKKYENIGLHTCVDCGSTAIVRGELTGTPYCKDCMQKYKRFNKFIDVDKFKEFGEE